MFGGSGSKPLIAHARGHPKGGGDGRKDSDGDVEDLAPDFFVHSF